VITSTALTLLVVPVIFALVEKLSFRKLPVLVRNQPGSVASAQVLNG
jgi:hypothetical protein